MKDEKSKKSMNKKWLTAAIAFLAAFAVALSVIIYSYLRPDTSHADKYKNSSAASSSVTSSEVTYPENPINFAELETTNSDICAWIKVPNTNIDYPILQSSEKDDDFYINHNYKKQYTQDGAIYIQRLNSFHFTDPNTVIYGHNLRNGSMFRHLHRFRDEQFFNENEYFYIYTPGHILTYRIFAAYRSDNKHILNTYDFTNKEIYQQYLDMVSNPPSMIKNVREGVKLTTDDKIVTLSTCISDERYRYLVQGVLVKDELTL